MGALSSKREENTYQQLDKDRRQELLYLFIFEAHNQKQIFLLNRVGS